jgi:L-asparaginase
MAHAIVPDRAGLAILTTGGTIEKTYCEAEGLLKNRQSVLAQMLGRLRLPELAVRHVSLTSKDSLDLTEDERRAIVEAILREAESGAVVVLHGTDTMAETGRMLHESGQRPRNPIIMTGAMRPFGYENSDAIQNLTEAISAARRLDGGMFIAFHGRLLPLPNVRKDREAGHFVETD